MSEQKYCKDCAYYRNGFPFFWVDSLKMCVAPKQGFDMQTGKPAVSFAGTARLSSYLCGKDAKWFKQK